jgi:hypothetical protein
MANEQQYTEGQLLLGDDGKTYRVRGGVPREVVSGGTPSTSGRPQPVLSRPDPAESQRLAISAANLGISRAQESRAQRDVDLDRQTLGYRIATQVAQIDEQLKRAKTLLENPSRTSISGGFQGLLPDVAFSIGSFLGEEKALDALAEWKALTGPAGLAELGELRAQSPTGGAVGQVSDFEQQLLRQAAGRFTNRLQSDESFDKAINEYVDKLTASRERIINAYETGFGVDLPKPNASAGASKTFKVKRRN